MRDVILSKWTSSFRPSASFKRQSNKKWKWIFSSKNPKNTPKNPSKTTYFACVQTSLVAPFRLILFAFTCKLIIALKIEIENCVVFFCALNQIYDLFVENSQSVWSNAKFFCIVLGEFGANRATNVRWLSSFSHCCFCFTCAWPKWVADSEQ